jgi:hypothetical protein
MAWLTGPRRGKRDPRTSTDRPGLVGEVRRPEGPTINGSGRTRPPDIEDARGSPRSVQARLSHAGFSTSYLHIRVQLRSVPILATLTEMSRCRARALPIHTNSCLYYEGVDKLSLRPVLMRFQSLSDLGHVPWARSCDLQGPENAVATTARSEFVYTLQLGTPIAMTHCREVR